MARVKAERPSFTFNKGLMTDANPLTFPADFSIDELNFELMLDGTRRRRRGLEAETEDVYVTETQSSTAPVRTFKWRAVADDPSLNFHVWQIGSILHFANDVPEPSSSIRNFTVDLVSQAVEGYEAQVDDTVVDMAFGRGHAIVTGKYIEPFYLEYSIADDEVVATRIDIRERDFQGVVDGVDNQTKPSTLSDAYAYNLVNQGWKFGDVELYFAAESNYPSKNMLYYLGYRRQTVAGYSDIDGTRQFSPDKLIAELFQDAPAPRGHFIQNPFDTTVNVTVESETVKNYVGGGWAPGSDDGFLPNSPNEMSLPSASNPTTQSLLTVTFQYPHFLVAGNVFTMYTANNGKIGSTTGDNNRWWDIVGNRTVEAVVDSRTVSFYNTLTNDHAGWRNTWPYSYYPNVYAYVGGTVLNIDGAIIDERPTCTAFYAGRAWYAGVPHPRLGSALYFSQVVEVDEQYGKCYQVADPTDENISDLLPTDGGVLRIPEVGRVYKLMPFSSSLLVFASNGMWEIGPGQSGYFTATSYSIRKISDTRVVNATSIVEAEGVPLCWARSGIFALVQDTNTGFLTAQSLTAQRIDTLYSTLGEAIKATATGDFDQVNKRAVWVYQDGAVSEALVFDLKFQAFTPWRFETQVSDIFTTTDVNASNTTLRFIAFEA